MPPVDAAASDVTLATLFPFSSRRFSPAPTRLFGKVVAHDELLVHLLGRRAVRGADIFASSLLDRVVDRERRECEAAIDEAFPPDGPRPRFRPLSDALSIVAREDYCFVSSGPESQRIGQMRWLAGPERCAITTLIHAVGWADLMPSYLGLLHTAEPCDSVVVTSAAAEVALTRILDWLRETCGATLRAPVVRIPLGTDARRADGFDKTCSRGILGIPERELVVLYVGRLTDEYKADLTPLMKVAADLGPSYPDLRLIVAGSNLDNYADRLRRAASSAGVSRHVTFAENPPDAVKHLLYAAADVFVSPSDSIQESFGLSLLEAMSHRLPVVASDWSGYRDIVSDGRTGFLIPTYLDASAPDRMSPLAPADATYGVPYQLSRHTIVDVDGLSARLNTLLSNPELRRAMGAEGRRIVDERFDWRVVIDRYRSLFAEQRQRLRDERPPSRRPLSVARVFGHYASAILAPETIVQCTDHGNRLLQALATRPQGAEGAVVAEILSVTRTPTPFAIWDGDSHTTSKEAAVVLLKSGALRVVR